MNEKTAYQNLRSLDLRELDEGAFVEALEYAWAIADSDRIDQFSREAATREGPKWLYWTKRAAMMAAFAREQHQRTLDIGHEALEIAAENGLRKEEGEVIGTIGLVHTVTGSYVPALEMFHRALDINREVGNKRGIGLNISNIGLTYSHLGEINKALEYYEESLTIFRDNHLTRYIARTSAFVAEAYRQLGRFDEAVEIICEGQTIFDELGSRSGVIYNSMIHARVLLEAGKLDECKKILDEIAADPTDYPDAIFETALVRANYTRAIGNLDSADQQFQELLVKAKESLRQAKVVEIYAALRDIAEQREDLKGYISYNKAFLAAMEEVAGRDTLQRITLQESERKIENERIEREQERSVLFSTLPRFVAERVIKGEHVTDHYDVATVLFLDIVDFTSKSSGLDADELVKVLEGVFEECDDICAKNELLKIKTIGDAYMAVAFNDQSTTSCVVRSVTVAFAFLRIKRTWPDGTPIRFRIGMNTGPVVAGIIGKNRLQYDVWGDTVNTASRMESTGEAGKVQVNHAFAKNLIPDLPDQVAEGAIFPTGPGWQLEARGLRDVKGKGAMNTFWIAPREG